MASTGRSTYTLVGELLEPRPQGLVLTALAQPRCGRLDEVGGPLVVLAGEGVHDRGLDVALLLAPPARPPVELEHRRRVLGEEPGPEHVGEEVVVPVPAATVVERDEEEVRPVEPFDHGGAVGATGHRVAGLGGEPIEDRRVEQERADLLGLVLEHLLGEEVDDEAVVAGEAGDEVGGVDAPLHRERGELQGRDPAFGAGLESGHVALVEAQAHRVVEVGGRFAVGEAEVRGADLEEIAACPQPTERQRRVGPAGDHQVGLAGEVVDQEAEGVVDLRAVDDVVVVEDDRDVVGAGGEIVQQRREDRLGRLRRPEERERVRSDPVVDGRDRGDQIGEEHGRVVVAGVE